jgi:hypothetical protein
MRKNVFLEKEKNLNFLTCALLKKLTINKVVFILLASANSVMVEHSPRQPKVKASSLGTNTALVERIWYKFLRF